MQNFQQSAVSPPVELEGFTVRQRLLSVSLSLAMTSSVSVTCTLANVPIPTPSMPTIPVVHVAGHSASTVSPTGSPSSHSLSGSNLYNLGLPVSNVLHMVNSSAQLPTSIKSWQASKSLVQSVAAAVSGKNDLNLGSSSANFSVSSIFSGQGLGGYSSITLDIGGKSETLSQLKTLTAAELVAAEQVVGGGKQDITINAKGVATGGYFDLTSASLKSLDGALGGSLNSLVVSSGVKVVDTVGNLDLSGSLVNMGSITVGASGAGSSDIISASNIYNGAGASISSASGANATGISLTTNGSFYNAGTISSGSTLNVSAPVINNVNASSGAASMHSGGVLSAAQNVNLSAGTINNTGFISSTSGNVNIANGGADIAVNGTGGTVQALKGDVNFNASGYTGSGNTTLTGGNYLSQQLNFNNGSGNIEANVAEVSGQVNGTADTSHITAASNDLNLGNLTVTGDPTYFNTNGNVTITGALVGDPDIAIVASGNIIGDGGSLNTSAAKTGNAQGNGGDITLIAGANFTTSPSSTGSSTATGNGDTTTTLTLTQSDNKGGGSKTGGYIDLSGFIETGVTKNTPLSAVDADGTTGTGGNITMVAYAGSAANSGNIIAASSVYAVPNTSVTPTPALVLSSTGAGGNGTVTLQGGGFVVFAQGINAGAINLTGETPTLSAPMTIFDGKTSGGTFVQPNYQSPPSNLTVTEILVGDMNGTGALNVVSAGLIGLEGTAHVLSANVLSTKSVVEGYDLNTSGAGGVSGQDLGNGVNNGLNGGAINITAQGIYVSFIDSSGSGGAGGSSADPVGGKGGDAGAINLTATTGDIEIGVYVNASGGGGGGGAGADVGVTTANAGGAGGAAGVVTLTAKGSLISDNAFGYTVLDFDGAAGGAGGVGTSLLAGGGGGGGAAFGGGGGGGAAGVGSTTAATGGGGGGTFYALGGGGGGAGAAAGTTSTFGGGGGTSYAVFGATYGGVSTGGAGGLSYVGSTATANLAGVAGIGGLVSSATQTRPNTGTGGNGGGYSTTTGGAGGGMDAPGSGGGLSTAGATSGTAGGNTTTAAAVGTAANSTINITVGANTGSTSDLITLDASNVNVTGTAKAAIYLGMGDQATNLVNTNLVAGSTFAMEEGHSLLTVVNPIEGAAVIELYATGGNVEVGGTAVYGGVVLDNPQSATKSITIDAGGTIQGITFSGNITAPGLSAPTVSLGTNYVPSEGSDITATISNTANLAVSAGANANLTLTTVAGQNINFTEGKAGTGGAGGSFNIATTGYGTITSTAAVTAPTVSISGSANVGTSSKPFLTDATTALTITGTGASNVYIKDSNASTLTLSGSAGVGSTINVVSAAENLTVSSLVFSNVAIQDTFTTTPKSKGTPSVTLPNAGYSIGDGTGTVSIIASSASILAGTAGGLIEGTAVTLKSTGGSIGASAAAPIDINSSSLTLSAAKGSVYVSDSGDTALNAGSALTNFSVIANQLTVAGAITAGGNIALSGNAGLVLNATVGSTTTLSVDLTSEDSISQTKTAVVSGVDVSVLSDGNVGTSAQNLIIKASGTLTVNASDPANGGQFYVTQTGKGALGQSEGAGSLYLTDTSALVVTAPATFTTGTVSLTAPSVTTQAGNNSVDGDISALNLTITSPLVSVGAGTTIVATSSTTMDAVKGALSISGGGSITPGQTLILGAYNTLGSVVKPIDTSITLGSATTGADDPLSLAFTANGGVNNLQVYTTGNFTSNLTSITAASNGGGGGSVYIGAGNVVSLGNTSYAPFTINANSAGSSYAGGNITLNLTGTQSVTLSSADGSKATGTNFLLNADQGGGPGGNISVQAAGNLTVAANGSGLTRAESVSGGSLSLISSKNLAVLSDQLNTSYGYQSITLQSGGTSAFTVDGGSTVVNGTDGKVQAANVSISAGGPVITAAAGDISAADSLTLANPNGALTVLSSQGVAGTIVVGSELNLMAKSGIVLGNIKTGADNPFVSSQFNTLSSLSIDTITGNFVSNISNFTLSSGSNNTLSINAGNILVVGATPSAITIDAGGAAGSGANLDFVLTGTQAVTIGAPASPGSAPYYNIFNSFGSATAIQTTGLLTVNSGGISLYSTGGATLSIGSTKGLEINDTALLSGSNNLSSLTLSSDSSTALNLGSATSTNYVAGSNIQAGNLTITDVSGITVGSTMTVSETSSGGVVDFNTKAFTNNGIVAGQSGGNGSGLAFNPYGSSNGLTIVNGANANYSGFSYLTVDADGAINLGNLFTTPDTLSNSLNIVQIHTPGSVTFGSSSSTTSPTVSVTQQGFIDVDASSLLTKASAPVTFVASDAGSVAIFTISPLTIGAAKGNVALNLTADDFLTLDSNGALTVSSPLSVQAAQLTGSSVIFNQSMSSSGALSITSTAASGGIITNTGSTISATGPTQLNLTSANTKLASAPIDISAGTVNLSGGAFNIQNSYTVGGAEITAGSSLSSLKYVASANVETSVSSINTTAGGISITSGAGLEVLSGSQLGTVGGGITLIANASLGGGSGVLALQDDSSLKTSAGSILVQNLAPSGQINLGTDVTVYGSGTAKGVGQVSFVVGSIPAANTLALGLIPNGVTISQSGGAAVTFGTTSDPGGTITASGSNYLNAAGRDVVFSQGSAGSISLGGGDSITADPPVSFGPASGSVAPLSPYSPAASPVVSYSAISFAASTLLALDTSTGNSSAVPSLSAAAAAASIMANANSSSYLLNFGSNNTTVTSAIGSQPAALGSMGSLTQVGETNVALNQNAVNNVLSGISDTNSISYPLQGGVSKAVKAAKSDDKKKNIAGRIERNLERGVTLIAPDSNTTVHTGFGSVDVAANAVALIVAFDGGVAVYNLHDNKHDSIVVSRNNHRLSLTPGRNAILTSRNISSFEEVNPAQNVGYRRVAANSYDDGVKAFQAEFSLPSMFHSIGALKHLVSSSDARDQKTVRSMLKTAAILQSFGGGDAVPFEIMAAPRLTAMGLNK